MGILTALCSLTDDHYSRCDRNATLANNLQQFDQCCIAATDLLGDQLVGVGLSLGFEIQICNNTILFQEYFANV